MSIDSTSVTFPADTADLRRRWSALLVVCMGVLLVVLDTTIVNVALPSIRKDLGFSDQSLIWVVNAYLLTFGGALLLGGRLGDLYGRKRLFLIGVTVFTLASLVCGLARSREMLIAARALQGVGGAVVMPVTLSLVMTLFREGPHRAKAMGIYSFVCAAGGGLGVLVGGAITSALSWHWAFLVNVPVGMASCLLSRALLPDSTSQRARGRLDVWGACLVTAASLLAVHAIVDGSSVSWRSTWTLTQFAAVSALVITFVMVERSVPAPLVPLRVFRDRSFTVGNLTYVLWAVGAFSWNYSATLYMQRVLGFAPIQVSLAFLPASVLMAFLSLGPVGWIITRFGLRMPLIVGLLMVVSGLTWFARLPVDGQVEWDILPAMLLLGGGSGLAYNALILAATRDVAMSESGLASGILNFSFMMGGAVGLAIVATAAVARTSAAIASGWTVTDALSSGYHLAFLIGAFCVTAAAVLAHIATGRHEVRPLPG